MHEAMFWKSEDHLVHCELCPRGCRIAENKKGFCRVRQNRGGKLWSLNWGKACSVAIDPIEKKPLFHFAPGSHALSVATVGCNLRCSFCQNAEISQAQRIWGEDLPPEKLIEIAQKERVQGFSWTYTEPTIFYEYFYDTAKMCQENSKQKFYQTWVTNGFTSLQAIENAAKYLHAANIDYKGTDREYRELCGAWLEPVQNAIKLYHKLGIWIELTNLIIPGWNDKPEQIRQMCEWIVENLGAQVPLHFSRYWPAYKMNAPPTPIATLETAAKIAEDVGIQFVYLGNVRHEKENTFCPNCKELLIRRTGFAVLGFYAVQKGKDWHCPACSAKIPLVVFE